MIARPVPSHRRVEAFEWKGPPVRIVAGLGTHASEKSL
jgi:hypothetical protein